MSWSTEEIKASAAAVARELESAGVAASETASSGGGSRQRGLPEDLRARFIKVRTALYERGVFDPVLVRFDTATAPPASTKEVAAQLAKVAEALR